MPSNARRGPWSTAEDQFLLSIVSQQGPNNWVRISQLVRSRTPKQCRERFHQNLKPSLNHDPITPDEGELIERLVAEMGKKWAEIARQLNGRSDNAVKNWWNGGQNRRRRMSERRRSEQQTAVAPSQHPNPYQPHYQHHHRHQLSLGHAPSDSSCHYYHHPRPSPLSIQPHPYGSRAYDTPIPSPSGQSVLSADGAPSLITDTGSETRSPHYAPSPMDHSLPPLIGRRDERRHSSYVFLPRDGSFVTDDENHLLPPFRASSVEDKKRDVLKLPEPQRCSPIPFREPNYSQRTLPLLTQGFPAASRPLPVEPSPPRACSSYSQQHRLPGFDTFAHQGRVSSVSLPAPHLPSFRSPSTGASKPNNVASILN